MAYLLSSDLSPSILLLYFSLFYSLIFSTLDPLIYLDSSRTSNLTKAALHWVHYHKLLHFLLLFAIFYLFKCSSFSNLFIVISLNRSQIRKTYLAFATIFEGYSTKPVSFKLQRKVFHHKTVPFCLMIFQQAMLMKLYK